MGLDVSAYRQLTKLDALFNEWGEPVNPETREPYTDCFMVSINPDFPGRADDLEDRAVYSYTDASSFWSGGYGRYNAWREQLAKLAGYEAVPHKLFTGHTELSHAAGAGKANSGPFHELIWFSDCEGVIGSTVSRKLAKDFAEWDDRAKAIGGDFYERYIEWRECFEMAADDGAVSFH